MSLNRGLLLWKSWSSLFGAPAEISNSDFHILPSGLLNPACQNLVGSGCVVHIPGLLKELAAIEDKIPSARDRLLISDRCQ